MRLSGSKRCALLDFVYPRPDRFVITPQLRRPASRATQLPPVWRTQCSDQCPLSGRVGGLSVGALLLEQNEGANSQGVHRTPQLPKLR